MDAVATAPDQATTRLAPFARLPVALLALGTATALLLTAGRYGYFGDELYFLAAGKHLAWGYADQPPLVPFLAWAMDSLAPGSLVVFRLPAIAATAGGVVVTALIARELGGRRKAQARAAAAYAICGQFVGSGHYLATSTIDPLLWTLVLWLLVRWVRTRADSLLVWLGVVTAVALNGKLLIGAFWVVAGLAVLVFGPRELLRRPKLWLGALIAAVSLVPTLLWQRANGWRARELRPEPPGRRRLGDRRARCPLRRRRAARERTAAAVPVPGLDGAGCRRGLPDRQRAVLLRRRHVRRAVGRGRGAPGRT
jgi:hypothetical protein